MAKGYRKSGVDFDDLFDPDIVGDGPSTANARSGGTPLKYAHIQYGSKGPDVGYRQGGTDVSNLWAAKGTAGYANRGGVPDLVSNEAVSSPSGGSSTALIRYQRNGTDQWTNGSQGSEGSGTWHPGGGTPGDLYDIKYSGSQPSGSSLVGADDVWRQVNADRVVTLTVTSPNSAGRSATTSINVQIRRRSDGAVVVNYTCTITATLTTDG